MHPHKRHWPRPCRQVHHYFVVNRPLGCQPDPSQILGAIVATSHRPAGVAFSRADSAADVVPGVSVCLSFALVFLPSLHHQKEAHSGAAVVRGSQHQLVLPRRGRPDGLDHLPDELGPDLGHGLVLGEGHVGEQGRVAGDAGLGVAVDIGLPLPAGCVRVACANVLGLEPLELLLGAELVGLMGWGTVWIWLALPFLVCLHSFVRGRGAGGGGHTILMFKAALLWRVELRMRDSLTAPIPTVDG